MNDESKQFYNPDLLMSLTTASEGLVVVELAARSGRQTLHRWEMETREKLIRKGLMQLGWTPPEEPRMRPLRKKARARIEELENALIAICNIWSGADDFVMAELESLGDAIERYPVMQGTGNQMAARRIGAAPFDGARASKTLHELDAAIRQCIKALGFSEKGARHALP